jgi:putative ABC transport system permease protein
MMGVLVNIVTGICSDVFQSAKENYYRDYRLADIFAKVNAIPASAIPDIERIEGIREVSGRYVYDARVVSDNTDKLITLRLISVDTGYEGTPLNDILITGNGFSGSFDIMADKAFQNAHGLKHGSAVRVVINRREYGLNICASADSPEYVYAVKTATEIMPNPETFGYAFIPTENIWAFSGQTGFYNDVCIELEDGVLYENVQSQLEDELKKYGLISIVRQKDQPSVAMVDMELNSIATISRVMPLIFMLMSAAVLYLMLKRIIEQERTQIGVLKAFGYGDGEIVWHYVSYGLITGAVGGILGCVYGAAVSVPYVEMFKSFFNLPTENTNIPPLLLVRSLLFAVSSGILGGYFGARRSLKLDPAQAMRPEAPKLVKFNLLTRLPLLKLILSSGGNMAVRTIARNKVRSAVIVLGLVFSFALMAFMGSYNLMIDYMMINLFSKSQLYDAKINFTKPVDFENAVGEVYGINGVSLAEGIMEIPAEIKNKHLKTGAVVSGIEKGSTLYKIYDNEKAVYHSPPETGIILSDVMAKKINAKKGDTLLVSSPLLDKDTPVAVTEVCSQNLGQGIYMDLGALNNFFNLKKTASSVVVLTENVSEINAYADTAKNISNIEDKASLLKGYEDLLAPFDFLIYAMWIFSVIISFAIIFNTSAISLSERKREYATLRVLGMQVTEVGEIMAFEYWLLCGVGIVFGVPFNMLLKQLLAKFFAADSFTFPATTPLSAYFMAAAGCILAVYLSNRSAAMQIRKFEMAEVLKERD